MSTDDHSLLEAQLASLLDINMELARRALQSCGYCFEVAVDIACNLNASQTRPGGSNGSSSASSSRTWVRNQSECGSSMQSAMPAVVAPSVDPDGDWLVSDDDGPAWSDSDGQWEDMEREFGEEMGREFGEEMRLLRHRVQPARLRRRVQPAKRRKTEHIPMPDNIQLSGNQHDEPAENPPMFKDHPLRQEQLKSLAWMLAMEGKLGNPSGGGPLRGGLLADRMGYGKTATAIGLISCTPKGTLQRKNGYIVSPATLIMCPSRLVQQWQDEFEKFLGDGVEIWRSSENEQPSKHKAGRGLKLLVLLSQRKCGNGNFISCMPKGIAVKDFASRFDVVLASSDLQAKEAYKKHLRLMSGTKKGTVMEKVCEGLRGALGEKGRCSDKASLLTDKFPVLQAFWWHRIVLDEFHESESWEYATREMTKAIGATHRWGLSGTPPLGSCDSVVQVAEQLWFPSLEKAPTMELFLKCLNPRAQGAAGIRSVDKFKDKPRSEEMLHEEVRRFLDGFVRQNSSEIIERIRIEEHTQLIDHVPEERIIYRQACHDHGVFDLQNGYDNVSLDVREALLKRCAHFDMLGGAKSASSAMQQLGVTKEERIKSVERQLRIDAGRAVLLGCWPDCQKELRSASLQNQEAISFIASLLQEPIDNLLSDCHGHGLKVKKELFTAQGELRQRPEVKLRQPIEQVECYLNAHHCHAVAHEVARRCDKEAAKLLGYMQVCEHACQGPCGKSASKALVVALPHIAGLLDAAHRSLQFYKAQMQGITNEAAEEECTICLEPMDNMRDLALLPCAHIFHSACVHDVLQKLHKCPNCQQVVQVSDMSTMVLELQAPESRPKAMEPSELPPALRAHGSKLNAIAECLREIKRDDENAQVIIFVQWIDLEAKVALALAEQNVPFLQLSRKANVADDLKQFQEGRSHWVLLLSLERAASGLQLSAANHVIFVHPMNASSRSIAMDYEQQAIGRIRRIGQTRSSVHVWRFVTRDTVEQHINNLHTST